MRANVFRRCAIVAMICAVGPIATAQVIIPIITRADVNEESLRLSIQGSNFTTTPLPRVLLGTDTGGFDELLVLDATHTSILAALPAVIPGSYRLIVQFGSRGIPIATLDITMGAVGPKGEKGDKGDTGPGSVAEITAGAGLLATPNPITTTGSISVAPGGIDNTMLANPSLIINAGPGLNGGGSAALGGDVTLAIATGGVVNSMLQNSSITVDAGAGLSGGGAASLGGALTLANTGVLSVGATSPLTSSGGQNPVIALSGPLDAALLGTGTIPNGRLAGTYSNAVNFSNPANSFTGSFVGGSFNGSGSGLTGLNPANLIAGTANISITGSAATATNFTGVLAGDVAGTQNTTFVTRLRGLPVSSTVPAIGQVLKFDGFGWAPAADAVGTGSSVAITSLAAGDANCPYGGTRFTAGTTTSYACNGAPASARTCPSGFVQTGKLCVEDPDACCYTFTQAANRCRALGAHLLTSAEMRAVLASGVVLSVTPLLDWLADQDADDSALYVNNASDASNPDGSRATGTSSWARCGISIE